MNKINQLLIFIIFFTINNLAFTDDHGIYIGGGIGYGIQNLSNNNINNGYNTPSIRMFTGYQFAKWVGAEIGYTYITQGDNIDNIGNPSTTIYDLAFTPGFTLPIVPVTIYTRLGIDAVSANLNSSWYNQVISDMRANFEWGGGIKIDIPETNTFIRAEYLNFGSVINNNNSTLTTQPSSVMITAAYIF